MNTKLINQYREKIRTFIEGQAKAPLPATVLIHLMDLYINNFTFSFEKMIEKSHAQLTISFSLGNMSIFTPITRKYIPFAKTLQYKIPRDDVSQLEFINNYLSKNILKEHGDLTSLLIAYFYYYQNVYNDLFEYAHLNQIIKPLRIFRSLEKIRFPYLRDNPYYVYEFACSSTEQASPPMVYILSKIVDGTSASDRAKFTNEYIIQLSSVLKSAFRLQTRSEYGKAIDFIKRAAQLITDYQRENEIHEIIAVQCKLENLATSNTAEIFQENLIPYVYRLEALSTAKSALLQKKLPEEMVLNIVSYF